jgi:hypothetical protein
MTAGGVGPGRAVLSEIHPRFPDFRPSKGAPTVPEGVTTMWAAGARLERSFRGTERTSGEGL